MVFYNNVFLVEDNIDQKFFIDAIKKINSCVKYTIAPTGEDALAKLRILRHLPDLVFLAINMIRMNGFGFLKHLKSKQAWNQIPVIILSSETNFAEQVNQGADAYIAKPFSSIRLQCAIENVFNLIGKKLDN